MTRKLAAAVLAIAFLAVGCGGGSSAPSTAVAPDSSEKETAAFIIRTCMDFVGEEIDTLIIGSGNIRLLRIKPGDPYFPIVNNTYNEFRADRFRFGQEKAMDMAIGKVEVWCAANAVTG